MINRIFVALLLFPFLTSFAQRKEEFSSYFRVAGVSYTDNKSRANQMDVYMPKKGSKSPVVIWIHGGNWTSGDKSEVDRKPEYFTSKGYIFIAVNYRLSPVASYLGQVQDIAAAIAWLHKNIIHYSGDQNKMFLMGYGTGAHLAATIGVQDKFLKNASGSRSMIKGIVTVEGNGFDIPSVIDFLGHKFREGCETAIGSSKRQWIEASPVTHVKDDPATPPFMIMYSRSDSPAGTDAQLFSSKLGKGDIKKKVVDYPHENSNSINRDIGKEGHKMGDDILAFFFECLR